VARQDGRRQRRHRAHRHRLARAERRHASRRLRSPRPADPQYDFARADASIVAARARGLQVLASFTGAPAWVDAPGRPAGVAPGTWKPSAQALED